VLLTVAGFQVPVMPLVDVEGKTGATAPLQIGAMAANVGVIIGFTVTVIVGDVAHWPVAGTKVYVAVVVLLTVAGLQVPGIPFVDVVGKIGAVAPLQIAPTGANVVVVGEEHASETQVAFVLAKHPVPIGKIVITTVALVPNPFNVNVFGTNVPAFTDAPPLTV
jgi:hypothetical protein